MAIVLDRLVRAGKLTQEEADGETLVGTAAFVRHDGGGLCLDGVGAAKGHRVFSRPIVRI